MEDEFDAPKKKKTNFFGQIKNFLVLLVIGFALGAIIMHAYIEPLISDNTKSLAECKNTKDLLNTEIENCYKTVSDLNAQIENKLLS